MTSTKRQQPTYVNLTIPSTTKTSTTNRNALPSRVTPTDVDYNLKLAEQLIKSNAPGSSKRDTGYYSSENIKKVAKAISGGKRSIISIIADLKELPTGQSIKDKGLSHSGLGSIDREKSIYGYSSDALGALDYNQPDNLEIELIVQDLMRLLESLLISVFRCNF